jgi:hypothetical protein
MLVIVVVVVIVVAAVVLLLLLIIILVIVVVVVVVVAALAAVNIIETFWLFVPNIFRKYQSSGILKFARNTKHHFRATF